MGSYSQMTNRKCLRRWAFASGLGLRPDREPWGLSIGQAWHSGMNAYYRAHMEGSPETALDRATVSALDRIRGVPVPDEMRDEADNYARRLPVLLEMYHGRMADRARDWSIIGVEVEADLKVRCPSGRRSPVSAFRVRVDLVARVDGYIAVIDHKTRAATKIDPMDVIKRRWSPQGVLYAWAAGEAMGHRVTRIGYDMAAVDKIAQSEDWQTLVNGSGLAKKVPGGALPSTLRGALALGGWAMGSQDWHADVMVDLELAEAARFALELHPVTSEQVEAAKADAYWSSTQIRRDRATLETLRRQVREADEHGTLSAVGESVANHETIAPFYRSGDECWAYGRPCEFMALCSSGDTAGLTTRRAEDAPAPEDPPVEIDY